MTEEVSTIMVRKGGEWTAVIPHMAEAAVKDGEGRTITTTYATRTEAATKEQLTDGSVTKVGLGTVGTETRPIYLNGGVPTAAREMATLDTEQVITGKKTFTTNPVTVERYEGVLTLKSNARRMADESLRGNNYAKLEIQDADGLVCARLASSRDLAGDDQIKTALTGYNHKGESNYVAIYRDYVTTKIPASAAPSNAVTTKAYVEATDGVTNNLVHRTSAERISGIKTFLEAIIGDLASIKKEFTIGSAADTGWFMMFDIGAPSTYNEVTVDFDLYTGFWNQVGNNSYAHVICKVTSRGANVTFFERSAATGSALPANSVALVKDSAGWHVMLNCSAVYNHYHAIINRAFRFGTGVETRGWVSQSTNTTKYATPTTADWDEVVMGGDHV